MENSSLDQTDNSKSIDYEATDSATASSPVILPKKTIQLGIVQSSTGARISPHINQSLTKKSRWDQAPGCGEIEEELKDVNVQSTNPEESNIKNLIKKFEDISGSLKSETDKTNDGSSSKPGRVKLVRTNFSKPENVSAKPNSSNTSSNQVPANNEKVELETIKLVESDDKTTNKSKVIPEVMPVSSSKALQIISSIYDSPSDESSQEADSVSSNVNQPKSLSDATISLEQVSDGNDDKEREGTIEERLRLSVSLKDESESSKIINEDLADSKFEDKKYDFAEEVAIDGSVTTNTDKCDSQIRGKEAEVTEGTSDEAVISLNISNTKKDEEEKHKHLEDCSSINDNSVCEQSKTCKNSESVVKEQNEENENSAVNIDKEEEPVNVTAATKEIDGMQARLDTIRIEGEYRRNFDAKKSINSQKPTCTSETVVEDNCKKDIEIESTATSISSEVNVSAIEDPPEEGSASVISSLSNEEDGDFVFVSYSDVEGCTPILPKKNSLAEDSIESNKPDTEGRDLNEESTNYQMFEEALQSEHLDNKSAEYNVKLEQNKPKVQDIFHTGISGSSHQVQNKELITSSTGKESATNTNEDKTQLYSDGVDAKMEQIFSENLNDVQEDTCALKHTIKEDLTSITHESTKENIAIEDSNNKNLINKESKEESSNSLLLILEAETSAEISDENIIDKPESNKSEPLYEKSFSYNREIAIEQSSSVTEESNLIDCKNSYLKAQVIGDSVENETLSETSLDKEEEFINLPEDISESIDNNEKKITLDDATNNKLSPQTESKIITQTVPGSDFQQSGIILEEKEDVQSLNNENEDNTQVTEEEFLNKVNTITGKNVIGLDPETSKDVSITTEDVTDPKTSKESDITEDIINPEISKEVSITEDFVDPKTKKEVSIIEEDVIGPETSKEVSETTTNLVNKEVDCPSSVADSQIIKDAGASETPDSENHSYKAEEYIELVEEGSGRQSSLVKSLDCVETTDTCELAENNVLEENNDIEVKSTPEKNTILVNKKEPTSSKDTKTVFKHDDSESEAMFDSNDLNQFVPTSNLPAALKERIFLDESKESVPESHVSVDESRSLDKVDGSIEVSQQETIERSIDMLFEIPSDDQPVKPSIVPSAITKQNDPQEVSSEAKKLFSEEIQKEMLKLSPEHDAQNEVDIINEGELSRVSPSINVSEHGDLMENGGNAEKMNDCSELSKESTSVNNSEVDKIPFELEEKKETLSTPDEYDIESECGDLVENEVNTAKRNDSFKLSMESTSVNNSEVDKIPFELKEKKETLLTPDESDIATIQAIDSFLEGDDNKTSKKESESISTVEKSSNEIVSEESVDVATNEEDSITFEGSSSKNERTNAEDVMLGVEGDLDLDNSLTCDGKKIDLSPSSEPSMSEENYDLPGDSYDKESLGKEQENSNLLSHALNDEEVNKKNNSKDNTCSKLRESKGVESHLPYESHGNEDETHSENLTISSKNQIIEKEDKVKFSSTDVITECIFDSGIKGKHELFKDKNVKSKNFIEQESSEVPDIKDQKIVPNQEGKATTYAEEKLELKERDKVSLAALREPISQTLKCKDIDQDFKNLIPSSTITSNEKCDNSSSTFDSSNIQESNENTLNYSRKLSCKTDEPKVNESAELLNEERVEPKEFIIMHDKKSLGLEELKVLKTENPDSIPVVKVDKNNPSVETFESKINESFNKTTKRPCSSIEEPVKKVDSDQDPMTTDTNGVPKRLKKSDIAGETYLNSTNKSDSLLIVPSQFSQEFPTLKTSFDTISSEENSILIASTPNQTEAESTTLTSSLKENTDNITESNLEAKSPKDQVTEISSSNETNLLSEEQITSSNSADVAPKSSQDVTSTETGEHDKKPGISPDDRSVSCAELTHQALAESMPPVLEQSSKPKAVIAKEIPPPVRVSARQKQRQAAAAAALAAKEKVEPDKSPGQSGIKKGVIQEKQGDKRIKKSLSPTKELYIKVSGKSLESGKQSPLATQKSPKNIESKINTQISPKKPSKEITQDKLEPIFLKLSKEENPVIVRSSLSPKKIVSPHSPQGKTLGYTMKIGKDSTTIIPKASTPSPTRRESSPGTSSKADLSGKVGYLIKDTGLTITPVAPSESQEQKLNKITLKLSKAGGHPEIKQENKSETWKAIRKLGEIDIVPVEGKSSPETPKRKEKSEDGSPEKKIKLGDVTVEPSTSSSVSKLQGLLTQAPLNQSDSSEDGKFIGFGSPTEKVSPAQQQAYDIGMIRHDDSPQPPRKRGRPRKITSPDDIVHSVSMQHSLPTGLTAKDILAASLQHQSLQQHLHSSYQPQQSFQPPEDMDSSQPMVPLFDLFEETFMDPAPPTVFPDQVQPSTDIIMRSARGRPIGRSRRPRGSGLMRGHERGGPRGRPRGSRGIKRILEEMEAMSFPDPDQPITLENIDAEMGPRMSEHAASELTMALLRKSIEGKKENSEKKARKSDGSEEGNSDLDAKVREMKEKIEAAYQAELKSPGKDGRKRTPDKLGLVTKSPPGLIPLYQKQDEVVRRKSADGIESIKRKLSEDRTEGILQHVTKRKSTDEKPDSVESNIDVSEKDDSQMDVDQSVTSVEESNEQEEIKTEPEPPPKPVKPRPKSKAEIKRIKREKDRLRREAKKLAALEALKAPPPNPSEEDTRMSASDLNGDGIDLDGSGIKKNRMEVGDPEGKEFTVEQIAEYQWPLQGGELYMIQEQISTWLGVKSFQRKYPDLKRRRVEMEERTYLCDSGLVSETMCDLGLTAVSSSEVLDVMFQDFPDQYEELRKYMREKQAREVILKQREKKKFEQTLSKSDLKEHAIQSLVSWNANLNRNRNETRKCHLDLQTWTIQYPKNKAAKMTRPSPKLGSYPVALIPGQYADYYKRYTPQELRYFPVNTVLYGPLQPNEMHSTGGSDGSQSESEDSSSSDGSSDSSSDGEGTEEDEKQRECKTCGSKRSNEAMLQCSQCSQNIHVKCADLNPRMLTHVRKYQWQCSVCKTCQRCNNAKNESKMLFCDLCDRGYHSYCVGLRRVPAGSWTCELCTTAEGTS